MKDTFGAAIAGLCAIHCAAGVILIAGGSTGLFAFLLHSEWVHRVFALFAVLFAVLSFPAAYERHGQRLPMLLGTLGIAFLLGGLVIETLETPLTVGGGFMTAVAHLWNRRLVSQLGAGAAQVA